MIDLTWMSYVIAGVGLYYVALFLMSLRPARRFVPGGDAADLLFVLVTPARNEAAVLEATLRLQLTLTGKDTLMVVVNDGSSDDTSAIAHRVAHEGDRVIVVDRSPPRAGIGKSDVLNHAYTVVRELRDAGDPRIAGHFAEQIILVVVDADGHLAPDALSTVAPWFADPSVAAVQIAVQIADARCGLLTRLQDMEFVAFSYFVQVARDRLGSVGLGGNGQFTRLRALESLGDEPWNVQSLTEDLDLGLRLVESGWKTAFCDQTAVSQQGLTELRPLFRQRTRWIQGHYQCWKHLPLLMRSRHVPWHTRLDLLNYLLLVTTVTLVFADLLLGVAGTAGLIRVTNHFLDFLPLDTQRYAQVALALAPISAFLYTYQRRSCFPLRWWETPAFGAAFTIYSYFWVFATLRAWARMATGRWSWVKTPRVVT